jgi:ribosomal protein L37AE/L43A
MSFRDISRILKGEERKDEIDKLMEKVNAIERWITLSNKQVNLLNKKVEEIGKILADPYEKYKKLNKESEFVVIEKYVCPQCGQAGYVTVKVKCTKCGYENWWGHWKFT